MSKNTNYKKRLIIVLLIIFGGYYTSYQLAFSVSLDMWNVFTRNEQSIKSIETIPSKIDHLQQEINYYDNFTNSGDSISVSSKERLIDFTEINCKKYNLLLVELSDPYIQQYDNYKVFYTQLILEGDYFHLIKFFYLLEAYSSDLLITSVKLYSDWDRKSKTIKTYCQIVFQTIKEINNE